MTDTAIDITDVAAVAALLGFSPDDECTPDDIDWGDAEPADGAPVFMHNGWYADDGNCEVAYPHAETAAEAARDYVSGGDWGDDRSETQWVTVHTWQVCASVDADGQPITGTYGHDSHTVPIEPAEPDCLEGEDHDWQSPHEILGGLEDNPGVWGHGGGVIISEVCMRCGCGRHTDTWAQNPENGVQGLTSVRYEPGEYDVGGES